MTDTPTYALVYAAKSTKDKHLSIPEQLDDCREMCEENGWKIVSEFSDENFTAYTGNRGPGLAAAIDHAKRTASEHGQCFIVAQHTSRFARGDGARPDAPRALVELWHDGPAPTSAVAWSRTTPRWRPVPPPRRVRPITTTANASPRA